MKLVVSIFFCVALGTIATITTASTLFYSPIAAPYPYILNSPYALAHPYYANPLVLTQSQLREASVVKHHRPDHKGDKDDEENENPQTPSSVKIIATSPFHGYQLRSPLTYQVAQPLPAATALQFHSQDGLGQYQYGYSNPQSAKIESKTVDGITRGAYSYIDSNGQLQAVSYVSDASGFRVTATNLPEQVKPVDIPDSPEVAAAKVELFKAQQEAIDRLAEAEKNDENQSKRTEDEEKFDV